MPLEQEIDVTALQSFYRRIAEVVGTDAMIAIWQEFHGTQLTIPTHLYDRHLASIHIRQKYDGTNLKTLVRQYGYSEKWVRQVLKDER